MRTELRFWAKTKDRSSLLYHPVSFHGLDVAAAGRRLLEANGDLRRRLAATCGLAEEPLLDWCSFLLALHDIGKLADSFQALRPDLMLVLQERTSRLPYVERHDALGLGLWREVLFPSLSGRKGLGMEQGSPAEWRDLLNPWIWAVMGHHGKPVAYRKRELTEKLFPLSVRQAALGFVSSLADLLLPAGLPFQLQRSEDDQEEQEDRFKVVSWLFAGVAVAADWIGSNSDWFPFHPDPWELERYWHEIALPQADRAVRESGLAPAAPGAAGGVRALWPELAAPTPLQALAETIDLADGPQLFVIEEVTGGGKTEAALVLAHRLMAKGDASGLYFGLPTMATANAMYRRIEPVFRRFFSDGESPSLALAHSRRDLFLLPEGLEEAQRDAAYVAGETTATLDSAAWLSDSRKKALLAHVGVGTIDQALIGVLPLRHQSLRFLGLAGKVLIVDEVHACDEYVRKLLAELLRFHAAFGGSAVLLSATLPERQRAELLGAFARGAGGEAPEPSETGYPLVSHWRPRGLREIPVASRQTSSRRVELLPLRDLRQVEERIADALDAGHCAAWIRNTVGDAREAYLRWQDRLGADRVMLFHSRFTVGDRIEIEREVLRRFGPDSTPADRRGRLLVATQVIEQSLDLDFDFLAVDLCPIDLVIQRAGRLRRHLRDAAGNRCAGPDGRGPATLGLFSPAAVPEAGPGWYRESFPRAAWVYDHPGRLWLTARWLDDHGGFSMPEDARDAIEWVYGPESGDRIPPALCAGSTRAEGKEAAEKSLALVNRLKLDRGYQTTDLDWPEDACTPTRLGEPTVTLRLVRETSEGRHEPWHPDRPRPWSLSEVSVRRSRVKAEDPSLPEGVVNDLRARMPDQGRYCLLAVLRAAGEDFAGTTQGPEGRVEIRYSSVLGIQVQPC